MKLDIARIQRYYIPVEETLDDLRAAGELVTSPRWEGVTAVHSDFQELLAYLRDIQQRIGKKTLQRAVIQRRLRCVLFD